ncbi:MAG: hypothetical protein Q4B08_05565 [Propionibacteriaceae bacterium]|nr:hypothetical protein [Propionibacteriaceae bacterium]
MGSGTLAVDTAALRSVYSRYEDLHTTMAAAAIQQPAGFDRSNGHATKAAGTIGEGISGFVTAIGQLASAVWEVAQHYQHVDACVSHDFDRFD